MIPPMVLMGQILGLGQAPSSFGQTLALILTFGGIGLLVNALIVYIVVQSLQERRENRERIRNLPE
jgi:hypothetical protein